MSILMQAANALSYLHAKDIIHGRLSAQNIFLENKVLSSSLLSINQYLALINFNLNLIFLSF